MTRILSGTAAVLAGSRTVAFTGAPLSDANCPVDGSVVLGGAAYFIASRTDTSHFELTRDYEGVNGTVSCEIDPLNANAINLVKVARSITEYNAKLALTDAYGKGLFYESIGFTGANDPGPGKLARNAAAWADSTEIYMDVLDFGGHEQGALIDLAKAGTVYIVRGIDTGAYAAYTLSAAPQNMGPDEWRKIALSYVDGDGLIADGELVAVEWNRKGESFAADAEVDDMAGRAAYDNEAPGFVVKVNNDGTGRAVFFTKGIGVGVWGSPAYLTGTKGDEGDQGEKGWSPQLVGVSDGTRRVLKLASYVGGAGAPPTANVGDYLKDDGTFTTNIALAMDMRGPAGTGNGTVVGPGAAVVGRVATYADTSGDLLADGGVLLSALIRADAAQALSSAQRGQARANIGAGTERRNWIINGDFTINQRGGTRTPGLGVYGYDRWKGHAAGLEQVVKALPAGEYTLTWSGGGNATFGGVTAASPIKATVAAGNTSVVVPSTATRVSLVDGDATGVADPFSPRDDELIRCQPYYCEVLVFALVTAASANNLLGGSVTPPVPMQATPSASVVSLGGSSNANVGTVTIDNLAPNGGRAVATSVAAGSAAFGVRVKLSAEL